MSYLTATLTARCRELHFIEKIVKDLIKSFCFMSRRKKTRARGSDIN